MYEKKILYDFTIRFYDPSLFCIFRAVSKMRFWQPCRQWILSDNRCIESTASLNSRTTHQIDRKNRVMANAWKCQKLYVIHDP
jgi:hypothetical protein